MPRLTKEEIEEFNRLFQRTPAIEETKDEGITPLHSNKVQRTDTRAVATSSSGLPTARRLDYASPNMRRIGQERYNEARERTAMDYEDPRGIASQMLALTNTPTSTNMEDTTMALALNAPPNGGATQNDTRIDPIPPSHPFHDTTTAILNFRGALSSNDITQDADFNGPTYFKIRMNTPVTPFAETTAYVAQVAFNEPVQGLSLTHVGRYASKDDTGPDSEKLVHRPLLSHVMPIVLASAEPSMLAYYEKLYEAYTVLKVDWKITCEVPCHIQQSDGAVLMAAHHNPTFPGKAAVHNFISYEVTGDSISPNYYSKGLNVGNMVKLIGFSEEGIVDVNDSRVFTGTWYPGKIKHNVLNDSDIDTWTATGSAPSSGHLEHLIVHPKASLATNTLANICANYYIELYYTVQYKNLDSRVKFPYAADPPIEMNFPDDLTQVGSTYP